MGTETEIDSASGIDEAVMENEENHLGEEAIFNFLNGDQLTLVVGSTAVVFAQRLLPPTSGAQLTGLLEGLIGRCVTHVVLISSALVSGVHHRLPGLHLEDQVPRSEQGNGVCRRWTGIEIAAEATSLAYPGLLLTILRTPTVLTAGDNQFPAGLFRRSLVMRYLGFDPPMQFLSPRDLARAVEEVVSRQAVGIFNVAPRANIDLRKALKIAGVRSLALPRILPVITTMLGKKLSGAASRDELELIRYPWTISGGKLGELRGRPSRYSSEEALRTFVGKPPEAEVVDPDPFGLDPRYMRLHQRLWLGLLAKFYWRIEVEGLEYIPKKGAALIVFPHRGVMPFDSIMLVQLLHQRAGRIPRSLMHPARLKPAFLSNLVRKFGGMIDCSENANHVLGRGKILVVYPEGLSAAFKSTKETYDIGRFGNPDYLKMASRHGAPVIPMVILGNTESYPILGKINWKWFRRLTEWPCLPIVPTPLPLPAKWHVRFLPPVQAPEGTSAGEEPGLDAVRDSHASITGRLRSTLAEMCGKRPSIYRGSIFGAGNAKGRK